MSINVGLNPKFSYVWIWLGSKNRLWQVVLANSCKYHDSKPRSVRKHSPGWGVLAIKQVNWNSKHIHYTIVWLFPIFTWSKKFYSNFYNMYVNWSFIVFFLNFLDNFFLNVTNTNWNNFFSSESHFKKVDLYRWNRSCCTIVWTDRIFIHRWVWWRCWCCSCWRRYSCHRCWTNHIMLRGVDHFFDTSVNLFPCVDYNVANHICEKLHMLGPFIISFVMV